MNQKTRMLFVINPGVFPSVTFVPSYDFNDRALEAETRAESTPVQRRESPTHNWTRAASHLPKVIRRLVPDSLWRKAAGPGAAA